MSKDGDNNCNIHVITMVLNDSLLSLSLLLQASRCFNQAYLVTNAIARSSSHTFAIGHRLCSAWVSHNCDWHGNYLPIQENYSRAHDQIHSCFVVSVSFSDLIPWSFA